MSNPGAAAQTISRPACSAARRHLRMLAGAPDPRRQAGLIHRALADEEGWSLHDRQKIDALGEWLDAGPPLSELRSRCGDVIAALG